MYSGFKTICRAGTSNQVHDYNHNVWGNINISDVNQNLHVEKKKSRWVWSVSVAKPKDMWNENKTQ